MLAALEAGDLDILVGTHAVISADVRFRSLALAVVDEQHKCGFRSHAVHVHCSTRTICYITGRSSQCSGAALLTGDSLAGSAWSSGRCCS